MSSPYIGEIRMFGGNFAPAGWVFCDGQLLSISENAALFQLIGTTYGGDGQSTFGIPDLQGRVPIHAGTLGGTTFVLSEKAGTEAVTLTTNQLPTHTHGFLASNDTATAVGPGGNLMATTNVAKKVYAAGASPPATMAAASMNGTGGSQPHDNMQPFLAVSYIMSLFGIFPSQT